MLVTATKLVLALALFGLTAFAVDVILTYAEGDKKEE